MRYQGNVFIEISANLSRLVNETSFYVIGIFEQPQGNFYQVFKAEDLLGESGLISEQSPITIPSFQSRKIARYNQNMYPLTPSTSSVITDIGEQVIGVSDTQGCFLLYLFDISSLQLTPVSELYCPYLPKSSFASIQFVKLENSNILLTQGIDHSK